jgi:predicted dehydrogenase
MSTARIAVAGAGLIGKRHVEEVDASRSAELSAIVDPGPAGPDLAEKYASRCTSRCPSCSRRTSRTESSSPRPTKCTSTAAWHALPQVCR